MVKNKRTGPDKMSALRAALAGLAVQITTTNLHQHRNVWPSSIGRDVYFAIRMGSGFDRNTQILKRVIREHCPQDTFVHCYVVQRSQSPVRTAFARVGVIALLAVDMRHDSRLGLG